KDAIIVRSATKLNKEIIDAAKQLKIIGRAGAGLDNIDLDFAKEKGIKVVNSPTAHAVSVAEHTMALLLAITKFIAIADKTMKEGKWLKKQFKNKEICGKILGIVGMGNIGQQVAIRASAFGMKVMFFDVLDECIEKGKELGCKAVESLDDLIAEVDYLTLHVPYNKKTHHLINAERIAKLKPTAILINTSRGKVIDQDALVKALEERRFAGAALDVFREEPVKPDDPILQLDNVVLTPHIASSTEENQVKAALIVAEKIADYLLNE
ncbi:MAG: hydroxyacid dehydrogenase, partial [Promethearchaeota archaeon]